jgi:hypothetical protein
MVVVLAASGCHSLLTPPDGGTKHGADMSMILVAPDMSTPDMTGIDAGGADMVPCQPTFTSCVGLCGPISDPCTGMDIQCGGCPMNQVCNLATHACEMPLADCTALGAKPVALGGNGCGNVRNSCGTRLFCGDCVAGKECDPDTNQCVACKYNLPTDTATACKAQGYQCGPAWLGCGPESTISDCGSCPPGPTPVCNPYFHICEPMCTPEPKAQACADALAQHGIECGIIDDGCGGFIDCGNTMCAAGTACGAQGDPGRCEPVEKPTECTALGKNCGTIPSECGGTVNCGTCPSGQVCNPNGICGAPCTPLTCGSAPTPPVCGTIPDGCGGNLGPCGMCPNPQSNYTCVNNACCKKKTCAVDYAGQCGTNLDDGCGSHDLDCSCANGGTCSTQNTPQVPGTCCVNTAVCTPGQCNVTLTNTCTNMPIICGCPTGDWCDTTTSPGTCRDCTYFPGIAHQPGQVGDTCSNGPAFDNNTVSCPCASNLACSKNGGPVSGTGNTGTCCQDTACNNFCGTTKNTCTGTTETCGCGSGSFCNNGTCTPYETCAMATNNGAICGYVPNGAPGGTQYCGCSTGECITGNPPHIVKNGETGTCCTPTKDSCKNRCNLPGPITTDSCLGTTVTCNCDSSHYCSGMSCVAYKVCGNYQTSNGGQGDVCGTNFDNGNGGTISCPCNPADPNLSCSGSPQGTCVCNAPACTSCTQNNTPNGCGANYAGCGCPDSKPNMNYTVCDPSGATPDGFGCCWPYSKTHLPSTYPVAGTDSNGDPVDSNNVPLCTPGGAISDGCGGSFSLNCPADNPNGDSTSDKSWPNVKCVAQPTGYGLCECTGTACISLPNPTGVNPNDGCGNIKNCGS